MSSEKNKSGLLVLILLIAIVFALLYKPSPLYYQNLLAKIQKTAPSKDLQSTQNSTGIQSTKNSSSSYVSPVYNTELRDAIKSGGSFSLSYNYIPSERAWHTMYTYVLYRYSDSGDCTFYVTKNAIGDSNSDLCSSYFSPAIWDEFVELVFGREPLIDCTSVYDSNGMVTNTPIDCTISTAQGIYSPSHMKEIEKYMKHLAIIAGVKADDLEWNNPVNDVDVADRSLVNLHGQFIYDGFYWIQDADQEKLEQYLKDKYIETGVRVYFIKMSYNDREDMPNFTKEMIHKATSPSIAICETSSDGGWYISWSVDSRRKAIFDEAYIEIGEILEKDAKPYDIVKDAVDKVYEIYSR